MTVYHCGLFDRYGNMVTKTTVNNKYRTVEAASEFVAAHSKEVPNDSFLCVTTEHKNSLAVYRIRSQENSRGKRLIQMEVAKTLDKEMVDVLTNRTLHASS